MFCCSASFFQRFPLALWKHNHHLVIMQAKTPSESRCHQISPPAIKPPPPVPLICAPRPFHSILFQVLYEKIKQSQWRSLKKSLLRQWPFLIQCLHAPDVSAGEQGARFLRRCLTWHEARAQSGWTPAGTRRSWAAWEAMGPLSSLFLAFPPSLPVTRAQVRKRSGRRDSFGFWF